MLCMECRTEHDEVYIHSQCHPESPTWTVINGNHQTVKVVCAECEKTVVIIRTAGLTGV